MAINNIRTVVVPSIGKLPLAANPGTFTPSGIESEFKRGRLPEDGDWVENSNNAMLELNINLVAGTDITAINNIKDEDITIRLADGQVHMMSLARVIKPSSFGDGESSITIEARTSARIS